jgi:hypothetical protein
MPSCLIAKQMLMICDNVTEEFIAEWFQSGCKSVLCNTNSNGENISASSKDHLLQTHKKTDYVLVTVVT